MNKFKLSALALAVSLAATTVSAAGPNPANDLDFVANGTFNDEIITKWTTDNPAVTLTPTDGDAAQGRYLTVSGRGTGSDSGVYTLKNLKAGQAYTVSAMVKYTEKLNVAFQFLFLGNETTGGGSPKLSKVLMSWSDTKMTGDWQKISYELTLPAEYDEVVGTEISFKTNGKDHADLLIDELTVVNKDGITQPGADAKVASITDVTTFTTVAADKTFTIKNLTGNGQDIAVMRISVAKQYGSFEDVRTFFASDVDLAKDYRFATLEEMGALQAFYATETDTAYPLFLALNGDAWSTKGVGGNSLDVWNMVIPAAAIVDTLDKDGVDTHKDADIDADGNARATDMFSIALTKAVGSVKHGHNFFPYLDKNVALIVYTAGDTVPPTVQPGITAPADVTFDATGDLTTLTSDQLGSATVVGFTDEVATHDVGDALEFPVGKTTTVVWTVSDGTADGTLTAKQTVTIVDKTVPVVGTPGTVVGTPGTVVGTTGTVVGTTGTVVDTTGTSKKSGGSLGLFIFFAGLVGIVRKRVK
jgi:hypothetical protein